MPYVKECLACHHQFTQLPYERLLKNPQQFDETGQLVFWYFNCVCGSTLAWPAKEIPQGQVALPVAIAGPIGAVMAKLAAGVSL